MNGMRKEIEKAKKEILRGIWKKKPTPFAKVCGNTSAHAQALSELQNNKVIETYSTTVVISKEERELEYYRWVPYRELSGRFELELLAVRKL
jgi:hypothetical protein